MRVNTRKLELLSFAMLSCPVTIRIKCPSLKFTLFDITIFFFGILQKARPHLKFVSAKQRWIKLLFQVLNGLA